MPDDLRSRLAAHPMQGKLTNRIVSHDPAGLEYRPAEDGAWGPLVAALCGQWLDDGPLFPCENGALVALGTLAEDEHRPALLAWLEEIGVDVRRAEG